MKTPVAGLFGSFSEPVYLDFDRLRLDPSIRLSTLIFNQLCTKFPFVRKLSMRDLFEELGVKAGDKRGEKPAAVIIISNLLISIDYRVVKSNQLLKQHFFSVFALALKNLLDPIIGSTEVQTQDS